MKVEIEYTIQEITKYRVMRNYTIDAPHGVRSVGFTGDIFSGEFDSRDAAEKVKDALEADLDRSLRGAIGADSSF